MNDNYIEIVNHLREQIDIVQVISNYVHLEHKGNNFVGLCPFHQDKNPSMYVSPTKKIYKCFSCGNSGDVFTFIKKIENISYSEAVKKACELSHIAPPTFFSKPKKINPNQNLYDAINKLSEFYSYMLKTKLGLEAKNYLNERGLDDKIIEYFKIGYAPKDQTLSIKYLRQNEKIDVNILDKIGVTSSSSGDILDRYYNRIVFPISDINSNLVGFSARRFLPNQENEAKYINTSETDIFKKGNLLYNLNNSLPEIKKSKVVYVLEGFMDVIALYRAGIYNAVAIMGTNISENHLNLFKKLGCEVRLLLDSDEPGQIGIEKSIFSLANYNIPTSVVRPFSLAKDSDELLNKYGSKVLIDALNDLISPINFLLERNGKLNLLVSSKQKEDFLNLIKPIYKCSNSLTKANDLSLISTNLHIEKDAISDILTSSNSGFNSVTNIKANNLNNKKSELIPNEYFSLNGEVCINLASYLEKKYVKQYPSKIKFKFLKALIFNEAQLIARIFKIRECYDYFISSKNSYSYFYISELSTLMLYIGEIYQQDSNLKNIDDSSFANLQTRLNLSMEEAINLNDSQQIGEYTNLINILNCLYYSKSNFDRCDFDNFARLIKNHIVNLNKFDIVNKRQ